jgi:hypothetical protein
MVSAFLPNPSSKVFTVLQPELSSWTLQPWRESEFRMQLIFGAKPIPACQATLTGEGNLPHCGGATLQTSNSTSSSNAAFPMELQAERCRC